MVILVKTIDKVHQAMEELNYQPNGLARSLQGKKYAADWFSLPFC